jgi:hypothetical protein
MGIDPEQVTESVTREVFENVTIGFLVVCATVKEYISYCTSFTRLRGQLQYRIAGCLELRSFCSRHTSNDMFRGNSREGHPAEKVCIAPQCAGAGRNNAKIFVLLRPFLVRRDHAFSTAHTRQQKKIAYGMLDLSQTAEEM